MCIFQDPLAIYILHIRDMCYNFLFGKVVINLLKVLIKNLNNFKMKKVFHCSAFHLESKLFVLNGWALKKEFKLSAPLLRNSPGLNWWSVRALKGGGVGLIRWVQVKGGTPFSSYWFHSRNNLSCWNAVEWTV